MRDNLCCWFSLHVTSTLFTSHHMYISSAYYLSICVLCTYYLQWSFICSFLTDNANVIYMSSLLLFIDPMMYNLVSIHCLHKHTLSSLHVVCTYTHYWECICHSQLIQEGCILHTVDNKRSLMGLSRNVELFYRSHVQSHWRHTTCHLYCVLFNFDLYSLRKPLFLICLLPLSNTWQALITNLISRGIYGRNVEFFISGCK